MVDNDIDFTITETSLFEYEIASLEEKGAILLGAIQILDDYLHFKKRKSKVPLTDINDMQKLIQEFLHILALIDAFQQFRDENQMLTDGNIDSFMSIASNSYSIKLKKFVNDLNDMIHFLFRWNNH